MAQILLELAFLFFVGSCLGWCLEVLFRRFFSAKKWINPGFLTGPYLPLYGFGLTFMYGVSYIPVHTGAAWADKLILILIAGVMLTALEYVAGIIFIKGMKIKLWDYSSRPGNIQGIICPLFSFFWTAAAAIYILFIHRFITGWVGWFVNHMGFAFFVGLFFGVFIVDLAHSLNLSVKIRKFAKENHIVISFEKLKESIKDGIENARVKAADRHKKMKASFLFAFKSVRPLQELLTEYWTLRQKNSVRKDSGDDKGCGKDKVAVNSQIESGCGENDGKKSPRDENGGEEPDVHSGRAEEK